MACSHPRMVPSDVTTDDDPPRLYSHCPACKGDFHPDSVQVAGVGALPAIPIIEPVIR